MSNYLSPKYLYALRDGKLLRADVHVSVCELVVFPPPIKSGEVVEAMMSNNPNLTIEQFDRRTVEETICLSAG